ncbi:probable cytochrome P450 9f2 isoform X1 [Lepeophtheirus salmonis]|uniref:probable cytochrome P450 9f2 isoform X1 n=1 Tax=Lepeophtheirus salmonis TaxID=72036 RepID=UPI001AEA1A07|nr:probable cytochrome P450 9f2 [Lepeophtheirus salmonis]
MYFAFIISVLVILLGWYYYKTTTGYGSFKAKGFSEEKASFPFGSKMFWDLYLRRRSFRDYANSYKQKYPHDKFFIAWDFGVPRVIVLDVELAKTILVKDFEYFSNRRPFPKLWGDKNKYFVNMMSVLSDIEKWKSIRTMMTPVFTSGKLKAMLPHLDQAADDMLDFIGKLDLKMIDSRYIISRYTTESIAKAGFGVEAGCFDTIDESPFMNNVDIITSRKGSKWRQALVFALFLFLPNWLVKILPISFLDPKSQDFFIKMIEGSIEHRKKSNVTRGDFVDLLIQEYNKIESKGQENGDEEEITQFDKDAKIQKMNLKALDKEELETLLIANVFILLFAGFETTSSMMTAMLVYLANYPEVQEKLFEEIFDTIQNNTNQNGILSYNEIMGMKYLDMFVHEVLRHFPFLTLERSCTKPYRIPGTNMDIDTETLFIFPNDAFSLNGEHFEEPTKFNPNNFEDEKKRERSVYSFMAFGHGPRNCIGMRFALLQIKTCIYRLLQSYKILPNEKTVDEIVVAPTEMNPDIKGGAWVKFEKRIN